MTIFLSKLDFDVYASGMQQRLMDLLVLCYFLSVSGRKELIKRTGLKITHCDYCELSQCAPKAFLLVYAMTQNNAIHCDVLVHA